jgi:hypothetical protein
VVCLLGREASRSASSHRTCSRRWMSMCIARGTPVLKPGTETSAIAFVCTPARCQIESMENACKHTSAAVGGCLHERWRRRRSCSGYPSRSPTTPTHSYIARSRGLFKQVAGAAGWAARASAAAGVDCNGTRCEGAAEASAFNLPHNHELERCVAAAWSIRMTTTGHWQQRIWSVLASMCGPLCPYGDRPLTGSSDMPVHSKR